MIALTAYEYQGAPVPFANDGYVNLTAMCRRFGKRPNEFMRLPSTQAFLAALAEDTGLPQKSDDGLPVITLSGESDAGKSHFTHEALVVTRRGGDQKSERNRINTGESRIDLEYGTWAHPDLALKCAQWISPQFDIWCTRIVRAILSGRDLAAEARARQLVDSQQANIRLALLDGEVPEIEGQVSVRAFVMAAGLDVPGVGSRGITGICTLCRGRCQRFKIIAGRSLQRRNDEVPRGQSGRHGWRPVGTFPAEIIALELRASGYVFLMPSAEALAAATDLLSRHPHKRPLAVPTTEPAADFSLDFGHGHEVPTEADRRQANFDRVLKTTPTA